MILEEELIIYGINNIEILSQAQDVSELLLRLIRVEKDVRLSLVFISTRGKLMCGSNVASLPVIAI